MNVVGLEKQYLSVASSFFRNMTFTTLVGRIMPLLQIFYVLLPKICVLIYTAKGIFSYVVNLRTLRWEIILDDMDGSNVITRDFKTGRRRWK
jgi:hypothetical protein